MQTCMRHMQPGGHTELASASGLVSLVSREREGRTRVKTLVDGNDDDRKKLVG